MRRGSRITGSRPSQVERKSLDGATYGEVFGLLSEHDLPLSRATVCIGVGAP
jgi:hypothetical protein